MKSKERIKCRVCGHKYAPPPDACPRCFTLQKGLEEVEVVKLPVEDMPLKEQGFIAGLIEGEGSFLIGLERKDMIKDMALSPAERVYHYNYLVPVFTLEMRKKPPVERVSKALAVPFYYYEKGERWIINTSAVPQVLAIAKWSLPYLTQNTIGRSTPEFP